MGIFKRKKSEPEPAPIPIPCAHLWQDFPWYLCDNYYGGRASQQSHIQIIEPYVCHLCHEVKEVTLWEEWESLTRKRHDEKCDKIMAQFRDRIKPAPVVKDMIHDMIMLDKQKLAAWNQLHGEVPSELIIKGEKND